MNRILLIFFILFFCCGKCFSQITDVNVNRTKESLAFAAANLDSLATKIKVAKEDAQQRFEARERVLILQRDALKVKRTALELNQEEEKNMTIEQWTERIKEREILVREEERIAYHFQALAAKKASFEQKIQQIEQALQDEFIEMMKLQNNKTNVELKAYLDALNDF